MIELLGVEPGAEDKHPASGAVDLPPAFIRTASAVGAWQNICKQAPPLMNPEQAWNWVFRRFVRWGALRGLPLYDDGLNRVDNNEIRAYIMLRRRWIVQYIDSLGILSGVNWLRARQTVVQDSVGITVNSVLECRDVPVTSMRQRLIANRWRPNRQVQTVGVGMGNMDYWRWLKTSEIGMTRVGFSAAGSARCSFWYTIVVPCHPFTPPGTDIQKYVLRELWFPVVRVLRFRSLTRNSTF